MPSEKVSQDEMCQHIFDFSNDVDNSYSVSMQDDPIILTRKCDGKQFIVGDCEGKSKESSTGLSPEAYHYEQNNPLLMKYGIEDDLKRFKSIASDSDVDVLKFKM